MGEDGADEGDTGEEALSENVTGTLEGGEEVTTSSPTNDSVEKGGEVTNPEDAPDDGYTFAPSPANPDPDGSGGGGDSSDE